MNHLLAELGSYGIVLISSYGYVGLAALTLLGGMFVPVPTELVLPLVGFLVLRGEFSFVAAAAVATAGSVGGALAVYALGYWLGEETLRRFVGRFGRFVLVRESDLDKVLGYFERRGGVAVLVGRIVPGASSFVSVPAGLARMPVFKYLAYTTIGCAVWNVAHIGLGWALGTQWRLVTEYAPMFQYAVIAAMVAGVLWFLWHRRRTAAAGGANTLRSSERKENPTSGRLIGPGLLRTPVPIHPSVEKQARSWKPALPSTLEGEHPVRLRGEPRHIRRCRPPAVNRGQTLLVLGGPTGHRAPLSNVDGNLVLPQLTE